MEYIYTRIQTHACLNVNTVIEGVEAHVDKKKLRSSFNPATQLAKSNGTASARTSDLDASVRTSLKSAQPTLFVSQSALLAHALSYFCTPLPTTHSTPPARLLPRNTTSHLSSICRACHLTVICRAYHLSVVRHGCSSGAFPHQPVRKAGLAHSTRAVCGAEHHLSSELAPRKERPSPTGSP